MDIRFFTKVWLLLRAVIMVVLWTVITVVLWCVVALAFYQSVVQSGEETVLGFLCGHFSSLFSVVINTVLWFWFHCFSKREGLL